MRARGGDGGSFVMQLNFIFIFDAAPSTCFTVAAVSRLTRLLKSIAIDSPPFHLNQTSQHFIIFFAQRPPKLLQSCSPCSAARSTLHRACLLHGVSRRGAPLITEVQRSLTPPVDQFTVVSEKSAGIFMRRNQPLSRFLMSR